MIDAFFALIGPVSTMELAVVAAAMLFAGFLRGFVGFGASLVIVLVLNVVLGPLAAVAIASLSGLPTTAQLLPAAIRHSERGFVLPFGITSFVAAPFGTWVLVSVEPAVMKIAIAIFVLAMVAMLQRGWRLGGPPGPGLLILAGIFAGLVQGSSGVGGPPAVALALSRPGTAERQRANVIGAVTALALCAIPALWYHGLFTKGVVVASLILVPIYLGATWAGARFFSHRGHQYFRNAALLSLAAIGVVTLSLSIRDYLGG